MTKRERLLIFGDPGVGKTYNALKIASYLPQHTFYWIDTDDACERGLEEFPKVKNVIVYPCSNWEQVEKAVDEIAGKAKAGDWVVVDMVDALWSYVQSYYIEQVFNKKKDDYFLEVRKSLKSGASTLGALKGWVDWAVINSIYQDLINRLCYQISAHLYLAAKSSSLSSSDEAEVKETFAGFYVKPEGEKRNPYRVHTVILLSKDRAGFYMTTVKDRGGRPKQDRVPLVDFYVQYLVNLAGFPLPS